MGTNFDWVPNGKHGEWLHIGKRSGAGGGLCSFALQGHEETDFGPIDSWAKWKQAMRAVPGGEVRDEYMYPYDIEAFIALVEETTPANRSRQYDWMVDHGHLTWPFTDRQPPTHFSGDWLCADGFSFSYREFS